MSTFSYLVRLAYWISALLLETQLIEYLAGLLTFSDLSRRMYLPLVRFRKWASPLL